MTQSQFENILQEVISTENEQSGSSVRMRYAGTTASSTYVTGAIIVLGNVSGCGFGGFNFTTIQSTLVLGVYRWNATKITVPKYFQCPGACSDGIDNDNDGLTDYPADPKCTSASDRSENTSGLQDGIIHFTDQEIQGGDKVDLGATLTHELGHGMWGTDHPDDASNPNCSDFFQQSIMYAYDYRPPAWRTLKDYDAEVIQYLSNPRSNSSSAIFKNASIGPTTWGTAGSASHLVNTGGRPLYRMGSMTQDISDRELVWVQNLSSTEGVGGGGTQLGEIYRGPSSSFVGTFVSDGLRRPVALAVSNYPGQGTDRIMAYERYAESLQAPYVANSDKFKVCYRRSTDSGVTWATEVCPGAYTRRYGLSAAFDPWTNTFLIGYIADSYLETPPGHQHPPDDVPLVAVLVVPTTTNHATPTQITVTGGQSFEAPSIACNGSSNGCRIIFDDAQTRYLTWFEAGVSFASGVVSTPVARTQGYLQQDTPSITYDQADGQFHLASTISNNAIYSYTMGSTGTSWTGSGDIWNNSSSYVSGAVVSTRRTATGWLLYAWFPHFF